MKKMTKYEQILMQKTLDSKQIKEESKRISKTRSMARTLSPTRQQESFAFTKDFDTRPYTSSASQSNLETFYPPTKSEENNNRTLKPDQSALSFELSQRGLTQEAALRKMTNDARIRISQQFKDLNTDTDIFLPKVRKLRPDGASLADVYRSKREDMWGKIVREQYREEEIMNKQKQKEKEIADSTYGAKLKAQIDLKHQLEANQHHQGDFMVTAQGGTWHQFETRNKEREAMRSVKHAEFVNNALHDIAVKKVQHMETLQQELSSSAYLVKKAQLEIEREKELARLKKEEEAKRLERLWNENQRNLIQKQKDREKKNELDRYQQILTRCSPDPSNRKYVKELDEKFQREEERRKAEVAKKASTNSTDRSAFLLAQSVVEESRRKQDELLSTIIHSENALSRQLKNSEDAARERHEKTKANLRKEFIKQRETDSFQRDTKSEDQQKIKADMDRAEREFLKSQERRRQAKQEAAQNYQRLLDQQLIERKEKSLATLKETMSPREKAMNAALFRKYGLQAN